jgi:hypothetical protein
VPRRAKQSYKERGSVFRRGDPAVSQCVKESEAELRREEFGIQKE